MKKLYGINLEIEAKKKLDILAKSKGSSASSVINTLIEKYLKEIENLKKPPAPPKTEEEIAKEKEESDRKLKEINEEYDRLQKEVNEKLDKEEKEKNGIAPIL